MSDAETPASSTSAAEPAAVDYDPAADAARAVERHRARLATTETSDASAQPAAPTTAPAPDAEEIEIAVAEDDEARLLEQARARLAERRQREPLEHVHRELAELKQSIAKAPGITAIAQAVAAGDHAALASALGAAGIDLGKVQQLSTKAKLQPSPVDQLAALIDAKLAPVLALVQPKVETATTGQQTAEERATSIDTYAEYVQGAAELYPLQAELGEYAPHAAMAYLRRKFWEQGLDPETAAEVRGLTHAQVAGMFEKELARQKAARPKPPGAPSIASGETKQPPGAPTASGGPNPTGAPRSVTNGLAASAAPPRPPQNDEEAYAYAVERQKARMRAS